MGPVLTKLCQRQPHRYTFKLCLSFNFKYIWFRFYSPSCWQLQWRWVHQAVPAESGSVYSSLLWQSRVNDNYDKLGCTARSTCRWASLSTMVSKSQSNIYVNEKEQFGHTSLTLCRLRSENSSEELRCFFWIQTLNMTALQLYFAFEYYSILSCNNRKNTFE